jgi:hypothetical protein
MENYDTCNADKKGKTMVLLCIKVQFLKRFRTCVKLG